MWIITREENDYDQHGEYFVVAFENKPTVERIMECLGWGDYLAEHLVDTGGGRTGNEQMWWNLREYKDGEVVERECQNMREDIKELEDLMQRTNEEYNKIESEYATKIRKLHLKLCKLRNACEHTFTKWSGDQYNRIRTCTICGDKEYRG
jgi:hypothetical protein